MHDLSNVSPLGSLLVRIARTHRTSVSQALDALGLHVGQELLLAHLCGREGIGQTALAAALGVELPTVHRSLARLERAGFVERRSDPGDARASHAYLTPRGRATCERIREIWVEAEAKLNDVLAPDECADLQRLLGALAERIERG